MERFMNAVLNIIQEGTGTRCPLDTTCIHDPTLTEASCDLSGDELAPHVWGGFEYLRCIQSYYCTQQASCERR